MLARLPHLHNQLPSLEHLTETLLKKVYPRLVRIIRVAKSVSGFHQVVLMRTDLTVIVAPSLQPILLLLSTRDQWQRRGNKQLQLSEAIRASQLLLREAISQATPRHLHRLLSKRSLVMNHPLLQSRTASLDPLDSIASLSSLKVLLPIHSRSALALVQARVLVAQVELKPAKPRTMVSSIQMLTKLPPTFPETISSPQLRLLEQTMVFASLMTEIESLLATSKSSTQKMASTKSPLATLRLTLVPVCLEVRLWLLKKVAGPLMPLKTRNKFLTPKITRAT